MNTPHRHGKHALLLLAILSLALGACQPMADMEGDDASADESTAAASTDSAGTDAAADDSPPTSGVSGGRDTVRETLVVVEPLAVGPIRDEVVVSAKVEARHSAQVFPKLSGLPVTSVALDEGDFVTAGDRLMVLYDTELRLAEQTADIREQEAQKEVDREQLKLAEQDKRILRAERQAEKASEDLERLEELVSDGLVNLQEVEDARLAAGTAADDLDLAHFSRDDGQMALALAGLRSAQAKVDSARARTDLSHTIVSAPISGVISERNVQRGELSSLSMAAFVIVNVDELLLNLRVAQDSVRRLQPGQKVEVRSVTQPGTQFEGVVRTVSPVLDKVTGTVHTIVDLDSTEGLVPGLFCEAHIITAARDEALLIDKRAVLYEDDQPIFFCVDETGTTVRKVAFLAGAATATRIELLSQLDGSPIDRDLRVVVVGQESLKDGAQVRVRETAY